MEAYLRKRYDVTHLCWRWFCEQ